MDIKNPDTLLELAIQSLLRNEHSTIHVLEDMPRRLFVPLFNAAFKGAHKKILAAMMKIWPFFCLHIGTLRVCGPHQELLRIMINSLQVSPVRTSASRRAKLRILDLREDTECETTCPEISTNSSFCLYACSYSDHFVLESEDECDRNADSESQSSRQAMEILADISLNGTVRETRFLSWILSKVKQSVGLLHLCCRDLQIDTLSECKKTLKLMSMPCIDSLSVEQTSLCEVTTLMSKMHNLGRLSLSKITFRSLEGRVFTTFLTHVKKMENLKEFSLSSITLSNHLEKLLSILPPTLDYLYLPSCKLSYRDFTCLSQSSQAYHLRLLNLSNNPMRWEDCEKIQILLEKLSGTLQHLAINHCLLTDSTVSLLLPALCRCFQLKEFTFTCNPISMPMLRRIIEQLTPLPELKYVLYPIPSHCYEGWYFHGNLNLHKLDEVKAQVKRLVQAARREDMNWITYSQ